MIRLGTSQSVSQKLINQQMMINIILETVIRLGIYHVIRLGTIWEYHRMIMSCHGM